MKALLLIVHGSRKASSGDEIIQLAGNIAALPSDFDHVRHSFLELAEPTVSTAIDELVALGCKQIVLMPYFLAAGFHVVDDLPQALEGAKKAHSHVEFTLTEHFGAAPHMPAWILEYVKA
jgi:sirohydrochlorin ferrochelatase